MQGGVCVYIYRSMQGGMRNQQFRKSAVSTTHAPFPPPPPTATTARRPGELRPTTTGRRPGELGQEARRAPSHDNMQVSPPAVAYHPRTYNTYYVHWTASFAPCALKSK